MLIPRTPPIESDVDEAWGPHQCLPHCVLIALELVDQAFPNGIVIDYRIAVSNKRIAVLESLTKARVLESAEREVGIDNPVNEEPLKPLLHEICLQCVDQDLILRKRGVKVEHIVDRSLLCWEERALFVPLAFAFARWIVEIMSFTKMAFDVRNTVRIERDRLPLLCAALTNPFLLFRVQLQLDIKAKTPNP